MFRGNDNEISTQDANALEVLDVKTKKHSKRVMHYTDLLCNELSLSKKDIENIKKATLLHDIGKLAVPKELLQKSKNLNKDEYNKMKQHASFTYQLISNQMQ